MRANRSSGPNCMLIPYAVTDTKWSSGSTQARRLADRVRRRGTIRPRILRCLSRSASALLRRWSGVHWPGGRSHQCGFGPVPAGAARLSWVFSIGGLQLGLPSGPRIVGRLRRGMSPACSEPARATGARDGVIRAGHAAALIRGPAVPGTLVAFVRALGLCELQPRRCPTQHRPPRAGSA